MRALNSMLPLAMNRAERVWTIDELTPETVSDGSLAVLGDPVAHSLSPVMHNAALAELARADPDFATWNYRLLHVPIEALPGALRRLHALGFKGVNLTIPHKVEALRLIHRVRPEAVPIGAVNTLLHTPDGFEGTNTDGWGIARAVEESFQRGFGDGPVLLCGAGGAARAIAVQALAEGVPELWIGNRSAPNLERLVEQLRHAGLPVERVKPFLFEAAPRGWSGPVLVVNATSSGLKATDTLPLDLTRLPAGSSIYDTTYGTRNAWAVEAEALGLSYADGLSMLVHQGVRSLELWTGRTVPVAAMARAARAALAARRQAHA